MTTYVYANNISTTLAAAASSSSTTLTLASATGLPSLSAGQIMPLTLNDASTGLVYEIVYVTAISGVTLTVTRAQEGTGAQNWSIGDYAFVAPTAGALNSPGFPNSPTMPTPSPGDNTTKGATTAYASLTGGLVGSARNLVAALASAGASLTVTADEIIAETALGGSPYRLASFSETLNVSGTGAGGMDTGTAPANGYVGIYAIYNPSTSTAALLGVNATSSAAPSVYSGAHMPAGYTLSALISVWPTNGSGQLVAGFQRSRDFSYSGVLTVLSATGIASTLTDLGISAAIPKNATRTKGYMQITNVSASNSYGFSVASDTSAYGFTYLQAWVGAGAGYGASGSYDIPVSTAQTMAYQQVGTNTSGTYVIQINGYSI